VVVAFAADVVVVASAAVVVAVASAVVDADVVAAVDVVVAAVDVVLAAVVVETAVVFVVAAVAVVWRHNYYPWALATLAKEVAFCHTVVASQREKEEMGLVNDKHHWRKLPVEEVVVLRLLVPDHHWGQKLA
jgi:hypothetical protein